MIKKTPWMVLRVDADTEHDYYEFPDDGKSTLCVSALREMHFRTPPMMRMIVSTKRLPGARHLLMYLGGVTGHEIVYWRPVKGSEGYQCLLDVVDEWLFESGFIDKHGPRFEDVDIWVKMEVPK